MMSRQVKYKYKPELVSAGRFPAEEQIGFIAQEVQTVMPSLVYPIDIEGAEASFTERNSTEEEPYLGVAYSRACVLAVEAIKELQSKHDMEIAAVRDDAQRQISQLEGQMKGLQDQVHELQEQLRSLFKNLQKST